MSRSLLGLLVGGSSLVVGVEDEPDGSVRMYVGQRSLGVYAIVEEPEAVEKLRRAWAQGGHVIVATPPPDVLWTERERP